MEVIRGESKTIAYQTLGCKLNFSETSTIARDFSERGYTRVKSSEKADVYVINTCSVTDQADKKCRQLVKKLIKQNPDAYIAVVGCYAQLKPKEIADIPGVDIVLGTKDKFNLPQYLENAEKRSAPEVLACEYKDIQEFNPSFSSDDRTRTFLKIQDGCDYFCTYCTIPLARGKSRNHSITQTIEQAKKVAATGSKEIILSGVNIGDFGRSTGENFFELIKELEKVEGIERYRISSIEPNLLSSEIIDFVAKSPKFLPHFHIPLQSGSDTVLSKMRRKYDTSLFKSKIEEIKSKIPDAFIGIDVIVGFPGETEELFEETFQLLDSLNISFLHVFSYSIRKNTKAALMENQVSSQEKEIRSKRLHKLSDKKHLQFYQRYIGTLERVLFEKATHNNKMFGFTENYIKVEADYNADWVGEIKEIQLGEFSGSGNLSIQNIEK